MKMTDKITAKKPAVGYPSERNNLAMGGVNKDLGGGWPYKGKGKSTGTATRMKGGAMTGKAHSEPD